jgi:hypothetical protein
MALHSEIIEGILKAHSGNIRFELSWTPVNPHLNCKKLLKKVPRLREYSENIQGTTFGEH